MNPDPKDIYKTINPEVCEEVFKEAEAKDFQPTKLPAANTIVCLDVKSVVKKK